MEENEREVKTHSKNRVWSWGAGTDGQLATAILQDSNFPQPLQFTANPISHIACGGAHVIALCKDNGKVLTWGRGTSGQLGHGDTKNCLHPLPVHKLENLVISNVSAGWNHSGFVSNTGRIFTCGDGSFGQLGHGDDQSQCLPREVLSLGSKNVEQVACGMRHTLVLLKGHAEDQIYGFGSGKRGQLCSSLDKIKRSSNLPQIILGFEGIEMASITANGDQSAALTVDGQLYTWGKGFNDNKTDTPYLLQSSPPSRYTKVALGWNHALLLSDCGDVFMLGGKRHGMLSDPQKTSLSRGASLVEVSGLDGVKVVDVAAGSEHSALVTENGTIMTWGWGEHGQLGLGNEEDQTTPQIVSLGVEHSSTQTGFNIYCGSGFTFAIAKASLESSL